MEQNDDLMALLADYVAQGGDPADFFQPFQQEQSVLDQQMQIANQLRQQPQQEHASIGGALAGGLSGALGQIGGAMGQQKALAGQTALGQRMQGDAGKRMQLMLADALRKKQAQDEQQAMLENVNLSPAEMLAAPAPQQTMYPWTLAR
jgi:hypothetical protein